jgi:hypothetical protein
LLALIASNSRSLKLRVLSTSARAICSRAAQGQERMKSCCRKLLCHIARVVDQAKRFAAEVATGVKRGRRILDQRHLQAARTYLEQMIPRVQQVMQQTREPPTRTPVDRRG